MMEFIRGLNNIFWGWLVAGILLGTGIFFTFIYRGIRFRGNRNRPDPIGFFKCP